MKFHPDVLAVHAEFGGDLVNMQRRYDSYDQNTRATPSADPLAGLDQYTYYPANFNGDVSKLTDFKGDEAGEGEYVLHSNAAAVVAKIKDYLAASNNVIDGLMNELAQIKATVKDANAVHVAMLRGDIAKPTLEQINHIYAAPVSDSLKAECERYEQALQDIVGLYQPRTPIQRAINIARAALNVEACK